MKFSRLFSALVVFGFATGATIVACGGGGGGGGGNADAPKTSDAKVYMDAPMGSAASGLGTNCTTNGSADPSKCPSSDKVCVTLNGTNFWCTKICGMGPGGGSAMSPAGGDAMCMTENTPGTEACNLYAGSGSNVPWACGIECGTQGSANLGTCPTGMTCTNNLCQ